MGKIRALLTTIRMVLMASGIIDIFLWFAAGYSVPSWVLGVIILASVPLVDAIAQIIEGQSGKESEDGA